MDKILINENRQAAENAIRQLTAQGKEITSLVNLWNSQPCLRKIETAEVCSQFLKAPISFLDSCVLTDTGIVFKKNSPDPSQVARLFSIQYDSVVQKINDCRVSSLRRNLFLFDEKTREVLMSEEGKQKLYEESKIYLSDAREVALYTELSEVCEVLNNYADKFNLDAVSRNQAAPALSLKCETDGIKWIFKPDISFIKGKIEKEKIRRIPVEKPETMAVE